MSNAAVKIIPLNRTVMVAWDVPNATGHHLKQLVFEQEPSLLVSEMRVLLNGTEILDDTPLASLNLQRSTLMHAVRRPRPVDTDAAPPQHEPQRQPWARAPYTAPPEVAYDLPVISESWSTERFFVWCLACEHKPLELEGQTMPHQLQYGAVRPRCAECGESCVDLPTTAISWLDIFQDSIVGSCFACTARAAEALPPDQQQVDADGELVPILRRIRFGFHCRGERATPIVIDDVPRTVCRGDSLSTMTVALPNVVLNTSDEDSVDQMYAEPVQVVFHPCGCRYSVPGFQINVQLYAEGRGGTTGTGTLRSLLVRNRQHPELFGEFVPRCFSANCAGIAYLPTCKILKPELRERIKEWAAVEAVLADNGILCPGCQSAFYPSSAGPKQFCSSCSNEICEQHSTLWRLCPHGIVMPPPDRSAEFGAYLQERIADVMTEGTMCRPPCCATSGGIKDDACTHIRCAVHGYWCYFCEKMCFQGHNDNWQTNKSRCPLWLQEHPECNGSPAVALAKFHRLRTIRLLHELRHNDAWPRDIFDYHYRRMPEELVTIRIDDRTKIRPITLEELNSYQTLARRVEYAMP